jgi:hypothetical protein
MAIDFVPGELRRAADAKLREPVISDNPNLVLAALRVQAQLESLRVAAGDSFLSSPPELSGLHVACGTRVPLTSADYANGLLERWCVVVVGIERQEDKWVDIRQAVLMTRENHVRARKPTWLVTAPDESKPCPCMQ